MCVPDVYRCLWRWEKGTLESQAVVSHPMWVLETKLWSSAAAASTLRWRAVGPAPPKLPLRTRL